MFYQEWQKAKQDGMEYTHFINSFLDASEESISELLYGSEREVVNAIKLLLTISIDEFLACIESDSAFTSRDVFQYSKLEDATITLCNFLEYENKELNFFEAGKKLTKSDRKFACTKYGENHIKLAEAFSFVKLEKKTSKKTNIASITALGSITVSMSDNDRNELIRRLAIRNPFIKSLLFNAKRGLVSYKELVSSALTGQTISRRKHNVEIIVDLILGDHSVKNNIRW